jgi:leucyl aminopeptidase
MRVETPQGPVGGLRGDVLVAPVLGAGPLPPVTARLAEAAGIDIAAIVARRGLRSPGDSTWIQVDAPFGCPDLLLVCVARGAEVSAGELRLAAVACGRTVHRPVAVCALAEVQVAGHDAAEIVVAGVAIGAYTFDRYKSERTEQLQVLRLAGADPAAAEFGRVCGEAANFSRDLTNTPPGDLTPGDFAGICEEKAAECDLSLRVLHVADLREGGFGGIVGVGSGSRHPPVLVCLESGNRSLPATALVGKGITFDTGGLDLKDSTSMLHMKDDMGGAAAVLAAMTAVHALGLPTHLQAFLPCAENAVGPDALRPGDVLRHRGGRTSEIVSTDAEGRLVLADAIAYAAESRPARIVDVATLTGGTGLGPDIWGVIGTSQPLIDAMLAAGTRAGEPGWQLPLWEGYRKDIRSEVADLRNHQFDMVWRQQAIWAALYLSEFVGSTPWAHLDTAATVFRTEPDGFWPIGATGSGTRTLVEFLRADAASADPDTSGSEPA